MSLVVEISLGKDLNLQEILLVAQGKAKVRVERTMLNELSFASGKKLSVVSVKVDPVPYGSVELSSEHVRAAVLVLISQLAKLKKAG